MPNRKYIESCIICNKNDFKEVLQKKSYSLVKCKNCGLFFINPQPTDKEIREAYSFKSGYLAGKQKFEDENNKNFIEKLNAFKKIKNNGKILDVGCATGDFICLAKEFGLEGYGIDIHRGAIKVAKKRGLNVSLGSLEKSRFKDKSFDFIHLGDVIEHVKNPARLLEECHRILKNEGIIIISTPNIEAFFPRVTYLIKKILSIQWSHPTPPHHLYEFSDKTIEKLLKKEKFEIKNISYTRISLLRSIGTTGYFDFLKNEYKNSSKQMTAIANIIIKNKFKNNLLLIAVSLVYGAIYLLDSIVYKISKKGNRMLLMAKKIK